MKSYVIGNDKYTEKKKYPDRKTYSYSINNK